MSTARTHLGDSHNFGRRVTRRSGRIVKPRALLWEWLVLSADSPLRRFLAEACDPPVSGTVPWARSARLDEAADSDLVGAG